MDKNQNKPGIGAPTFCHLDAIREGERRLFSVFQLPDLQLRRALYAALLVVNSITLLSGTYGTGKTQLVALIRRLFFSGKDDLYAIATCHNELTPFDVLYHLDLAELQKGREVVHPKGMVNARLKFFNEIQRAGTGFFNAMLPLLAERCVSYRDHEFAVPDGLVLMDRNPQDAGSSEVPEAFLDRVDFHFEISAIHLRESLRLHDLRRGEEGFRWDGLEGMVEPVLEFDSLSRVWEDVRRVEIPPRPALLAGMLSDAFRLCLATDRSTARNEYDLACGECQFRGEICSHLNRVPGQRVTNSVFRLSQALAWLEGKGEVSPDDILAAFPWCLSHRLGLRPEELRKKPSEQAWVREVALGEVLCPKLPFWEQALAAFEGGDEAKIKELGENDLVVREIQLLPKHEAA